MMLRLHMSTSAALCRGSKRSSLVQTIKPLLCDLAIGAPPRRSLSTHVRTGSDGAL